MAPEYFRVTDWRTRVETLGHSVGVFGAAFVVGLVLSQIGLIAAVAAGVAEPSLENPPPSLYAAVTVLQFLGFGLVVYAYVHWWDSPDLLYLRRPSLRDLGWAGLGVVGLFAVAYAGSIIIQFLGVDTATNSVVTTGRNAPLLFLYLIPVTILLQAPMEELLFRGVVQGLLRRAYGVVPAVLLASVMFGIGHTIALQGSLSGKLNTIVLLSGLGLVLGTVYERSESIVVPMLVHGAWNAFLFGTQYLVASGAVQA
ncbi:MAG: lysostaphin resistance A-like protein [Haloarculaceae archaeon]